MNQMEQLKPPKDFDTLLYWNFTCILAIAFLFMTYANGESTIRYVSTFNPSDLLSQITEHQNFGLFNVSINYSLEDINSRNAGLLMKYRNDLIKQNYKIPYIQLGIYWILMPLIDWIYIIWYFTKIYKHHYSKLEGGDFNG